jgi:hypothetical protein
LPVECRAAHDVATTPRARETFRTDLSQQCELELKRPALWTRPAFSASLAVFVLGAALPLARKPPDIEDNSACIGARHAQPAKRLKRLLIG